MAASAASRFHGGAASGSGVLCTCPLVRAHGDWRHGEVSTGVHAFSTATDLLAGGWVCNSAFTIPQSLHCSKALLTWLESTISN